MGADHRSDLGDEQRVGAHHLATALDQPLGVLGILDVLHDPGVATVGVQLLGVLDQPLEDPPASANALDRCDLVVEVCLTN